MERFEFKDDQGRLISYAALLGSPTGGVVFVDDKLVGTVTPHQAQDFYSCRGYATATSRHWTQDGSAWVSALLLTAKPADTLTLTFAPTSSAHSIRSVVNNPLIGQVKSLIDISTNPFNIVKTISNARDNHREKERNTELLKALTSLAPGDSEMKLSETLVPGNVTFLPGGLVMGYPKYSIEFIISQGRIALMHQPAFHQLATEHAELFYVPGADWTKCTPADWQHLTASSEDAPTVSK